MTTPYLPNHIGNRLPNKDSHSSKKVAHLPSSLNTSLSPIASAVKVSLVGLVGLSLVHGAAQAATIQVTSNSDDSTNNANCTLREAITAFNSPSSLPLSSDNNASVTLTTGCVLTGTASSDDTITFSPNLPNNTIVLNQGELEITENADVTINASTIDGGIIVDGDNSFRVFDIYGATVSIDSLTITNGSHLFGTGGGGGLFADSYASVEVKNSTVSNNTVAIPARGGGGIEVNSSSSVTLINSLVEGNTAYGSSGGGGIRAARDSTLVLIDSTVNNNTAQPINGFGGSGGGIVAGGSSLELQNSVVSNNMASSNGGGIDAVSVRSFVIANSTVTNNITSRDGGGIGLGGPSGVFNSGITYELTNSTVSNNTAGRSGGGIHIIGRLNINIDNLSLIHI